MRASTYVPPSGSASEASIVIVGEQPGVQEVRQRRPFVGPSGQNLIECLYAAKIDDGEVYKTNVIKDLDRPLSEYIDIRSGKNAKALVSPMGQQYIDELIEELNQTRANVIVACGNIALFVLTSRIGISSWRGSIVESTLLPGRKVIPTFHPANWTREKLFNNPSLYLYKYLVVIDLKRAKEQSQFAELRSLPRKLITRPTYYEAISFIDECIAFGHRGHVIDYDIELSAHTQELSCIGFAYDETLAMCIPFMDHNGDYYTVEQELHIMLCISALMQDASIIKRGQNVIFDSHFLLRKYGIRTHNMECTMIAQGILWPEFRKSLEFITSIWTDIPYYKRDGKIWLSGGNDWENGWRYNCLDVLSCAAAHPKQLQELELQGNSNTYNRQKRLIEPLTYMMERGIKIDVEGMRLAAQDCEKQIVELVEGLSAVMERDCVASAEQMVTKKEFNLNSPAQLAQYFYEELGYKPYLDPDTGRPTTDAIALTRLANKGCKEANLVLKLRSLSKQKSTFLDTTQIDSDGRMRCQYNPVGTKFGRISSSENIFGTGTNLQNQPHSVLTHFIADEGYVIYSMDMSQIENRIVAYYGNITPMIEAFARGIDLHRLTAAMTLKILFNVKKSLEEISRSERENYGKRPNHGFNYGYGYKSYSLKYEVPEVEAKQVHNAYHMIYPQLRSSYWQGIQNDLRRDRCLVTLLGRVIPFFGKWDDKLLNAAYSAIPQSTNGDHVNDRGVNFIYYSDDPDLQLVELLLPIHDSIDFQMPLSVPLSVHARTLLKIRASLETPFQVHGHSFSVPADLVVNKCLNKELGVELKGNNFPYSPTALQHALHVAMTKLGIH